MQTPRDILVSESWELVITVSPIHQYTIFEDVKAAKYCLVYFNYIFLVTFAFSNHSRCYIFLVLSSPTTLGVCFLGNILTFNSLKICS